MFPTLKIVALSAVLAGGLVAASMPTGASVPTAKAFAERLPQAGLGETARIAPAAPLTGVAPRGDALPDESCARAVWPYLPRGCVAGAARPVRTITIEQRDAAGSTLARVPAARIAAR